MIRESFAMALESENFPAEFAMGYLKSIQLFVEGGLINAKAIAIIAAYLQNRCWASILDKNPNYIAGDFVSAAWKDNPDLLNSIPGVLPRPLILAAFSVANGLKIYEDSDLRRAAVISVFCNILMQIHSTVDPLSMNDLENEMLAVTLHVLSLVHRERKDTTESLSLDETLRELGLL